MTKIFFNILRIVSQVSLLAAFLFIGNFATAAPWRPPTNAPLQSTFLQPLIEGTDDQVKQGVLRTLGLISSAKIFVPFGVTQPTTSDVDFTNNVSVWSGGKMRANDFCLWNGSTCTRVLSSFISSAVPRQILAGRAPSITNAATVACYPGGAFCAISGAANYYFLGNVISTTSAVPVSNLAVYASPSGGSCTYTVSYLPNGCQSGTENRTAVSCVINSGGSSCSSGALSATLPANACVRLYVDRGSGATCTAATSWSFAAN